MIAKVRKSLGDLRKSIMEHKLRTALAAAGVGAIGGAIYKRKSIGGVMNKIHMMIKEKAESSKVIKYIKEHVKALAATGVLAVVASGAYNYRKSQQGKGPKMETARASPAYKAVKDFLIAHKKKLIAAGVIAAAGAVAAYKVRKSLKDATDFQLGNGKGRVSKRKNMTRKSKRQSGKGIFSSAESYKQKLSERVNQIRKSISDKKNEMAAKYPRISQHAPMAAKVAAGSALAAGAVYGLNKLRKSKKVRASLSKLKAKISKMRK